MSDEKKSAVARLYAELREIAVLRSALYTLSWDQETMMPAQGGELRSSQSSLLAGMVHERFACAKVGELLAAAEDEAGGAEAAASVREVRRDYDKATKLPQDLIEEMARASSLGMEAWKQARAKNDFAMFLPWLEKTVELNTRKAKCLGAPAGGELYDALLDEYEPGMTAARTAEIFAPLRNFTIELMERVRAAPKLESRFAEVELPLERQRDFSMRIAQAIGFAFDAGRMDDSTHPFCEGIGPGDTRITNRYRPDGWLDSLSSAMHEAGHGLYEQGLPKQEHFGNPLGEAVSLGIHESQSRLWENLVGRSLPFWRWAIDVAKETLGPALAEATAEEIFTASNRVAATLIRVESDEVTYNLHIMLRFELERAMIRGELPPSELPGVWNERFREYVGLEVPEDRRGCLQDVHWSMGAMGYFPTYTFGNLYASQLWEAMGEDLSDRDAQMEQGDFHGILSWLRDKVHRHGRRYAAEQLCEMATGKPLSAEPLMRHLRAKVEGIGG